MSLSDKLFIGFAAVVIMGAGAMAGVAYRAGSEAAEACHATGGVPLVARDGRFCIKRDALLELKP